MVRLRVVQTRLSGSESEMPRWAIPDPMVEARARFRLGAALEHPPIFNRRYRERCPEKRRWRRLG